SPNMSSLIQKISQCEFRSLQECDRYVPQEIEEIISKCMAKNPRDRYDSVGRTAADINQFLSIADITNSKDQVERFLMSPKKFKNNLKNKILASHINRGSIFREKGMIFEAMREYENVLKLDPDNEEIQGLLAALKIKKPDYKRDLNRTFTNVRLKTGNKNLYLVLFAVFAVFGLLLIFFGRMVFKGRSLPVQPDSLLRAGYLTVENAETENKSGIIAEKPVSEELEEVGKKQETIPGKKQTNKTNNETETPFHPTNNKKTRELMDNTLVTNKGTTQNPGEKCFGNLFVWSAWVSDLYLNQVLKGIAPFKDAMRLECGEYYLKLQTHSYGRTYIKKINILENQVLRLQINKEDFK
ncbi:MAG: hypothetical protein ABIA63_10155, partial [bacterium]